MQKLISTTLIDPHRVQNINTKLMYNKIQLEDEILPFIGQHQDYRFFNYHQYDRVEYAPGILNETIY